ncbi:MAG: hypothetical protein GY930_06300 [bacterium]|nr:hypothetical protein [bacterium]
MSSRQYLRSAAHLDGEFQVSVRGGLMVTTTQLQFTGPTCPQEVVQVGPIQPSDHIAITIPTGLTPHVDSADPHSLNVRLRGNRDVFPRGRAGLLRANLAPDGSFEVLVPAGFVEDPSAVLEVDLRTWGRELAHGIVHGGPRDSGHYDIEPPEPNQLRRPDTSGLIPGRTPDEATILPVVLAGTVIDNQGCPVPMAKVEVAQDDPMATREMWGRPDEISLRGIRCDDQGRFEARFTTHAKRLRVVASAPGLGLLKPVFCKPGNNELAIRILPPTGDRAFFRSTYTSFTPMKTGRGSLPLVLVTTDGKPIERKVVMARYIAAPPPPQKTDSPNAKPKTQAKRSGHIDRWRTIQTNLLGQVDFTPRDILPLDGTIEVYSTDPGKPLLYVLLAVPDRADFPIKLTLAETPPALAGRLIDESGAPIEEARLTVQHYVDSDAGPGKPVAEAAFLPNAPRSSTISGANGEFELCAYPTTSPLHIRMDDKTGERFPTDQIVSHGDRDLTLVARRLGSIEVELQMPPGTHSNDVVIELLRLESEEVIPCRRSRNSNTLSIERLDPGEYRLIFKLPKRIPLSPNNSRPGHDFLYQSDSFAVEGGVQKKLPAINLNGRFRAIRIAATFEGNPIRISPEHFGLRPIQRGRRFFFASFDRSARLVLARGHNLEVALRGRFQVFGETLSLQSPPTAIPNGATELNLVLERSPARTITIDSESMALIAPYELNALLVPGTLSTTSNWQLPFPGVDRAEQRLVRIQPNGKATLPRRPCFPGELEPDQLLLALCYNPTGAPSRLESEFESLHRARGARPKFSPRGTSALFDLSQTNSKPEPVQNARTHDLLWLEILVLPNLSSPLPPRPHLPRAGSNPFSQETRPPCEYYSFYLPSYLHEPIPIALPTKILKAAHKRMQER